jgi:hypothetical protein
MIFVQIATALAIGAYVVLSKDSRRKRPDAIPRESFQHPADHLIERTAALSSRRSNCILTRTDDECSRKWRMGQLHSAGRRTATYSFARRDVEFRH